MLVLTRKTGEEILITDADGRTLRIKVVENRRNELKIGIDAPKDMKIVRAEVAQAVSDANVEAARTTPDTEGRLKALLGITPEAPGSAA